jgi:hypothetical protein
MADDLMQYIASRTPKNFLQLATESLEAAFVRAYREASTYEHPEYRRMQGQVGITDRTKR